ncbi:MAG: glycoside hydrolase family 5 protein [Lachnoclostridium sp.]|nr:glycoside hydrolase family 5 protein [Lachnoclostridium sp.]
MKENVLTPKLAAGDTNNDDWLHVEGNKICDINGNEVWLTGVNWFGFNCNEVMFHGLDAGKDFRIIAEGIADHGFNIVRIPIASELIISWMNGTPKKGSTNFANDAPYYVNNPWFLTPEGEQMNSMEIFDTCLKIFKEYGLKVFIDIHSPDINNSGHDYELWYGKGGTTTKLWIDSLVWLAEKYKNDDTLLAYDLKNEPHGKAQDVPTGKGAKWDDSDDENNWRKAAEDCGNAIMAVNPNALILVEGVEVFPREGQTYASPPGGYGAPENFYGAWWGGNLRGVKDYPITIKNPETGHSQLVYSPHEYGPSVYPQTWFAKDFSLQTLHDDYMHDTWDYLLPDYPLLIGEWGGHMDGDINQKWMTILRDYMIDNRVHHTFWCVNPNSGDTGGLLDHSWEKWDDVKYGLVEPSLWQDDEGTFIGLDHEKPLGENGMSLNDYYGGSSQTSTSTSESPIDTDDTSSSSTSESPIDTDDTSSSSTTAETTTYTIPNPENGWNWGDVDENGNVDIADVVLTAQILINQKTVMDFPLNEDNIPIGFVQSHAYSKIATAEADPTGKDLMQILLFVLGKFPEI